MKPKVLAVRQVEAGVAAAPPRRGTLVIPVLADEAELDSERSDRICWRCQACRSKSPGCRHSRCASTAGSGRCRRRCARVFSSNARARLPVSRIAAVCAELYCCDSIIQMPDPDHRDEADDRGAFGQQQQRVAPGCALPASQPNRPAAGPTKRFPADPGPRQLGGGSRRPGLLEGGDMPLIYGARVNFALPRPRGRRPPARSAESLTGPRLGCPTRPAFAATARFAPVCLPRSRNGATR